MADILVVDDDKMLCTMLVEHLRRGGYDAEGANTLAAGVEMAKAHAYDVVFLDVQMPDGSGLDFIPKFKETTSAPEVVIITGKGDPDGAEKAISSGAWSYIEKPHVIRSLMLHLTRVLQYREEKNRIKTVPVALKRDKIIGNSPGIKECLDKVARAAGCDASVLITGETGTGKEIFARAIHENSSRSRENFVVVDCASLPETLIESTLFGHARGAFTGADKAKEGLIKHADKGTLFLDEIGELPLTLQKSLLRVLQEHRYRPVGDTKEVASNFRVVAATNRDLAEQVAAKNFRDDLLFRLQAIHIHLPPLRERAEDIKELSTYYIDRLCNRYGMQPKGIANDFIEALAAYDWPGNVRELFQVLENVLATAVHHPTLFSMHLPQNLRVIQAKAGISSAGSNFSGDTSLEKDSFPPWRDYKDEFEKKYVEKLMQFSGGKKNVACRLSGLSRTRLYQLLNKYDI